MSEPIEAVSDVELGEILRTAVGDAHVHELDPPLKRGGAELGWLAEPPDVDACARLLAALHGVGVGALVVGGATRIEDGAPASAARVMLSTQGLAGVLQFEDEEGVIEVGGGTRILDLLDHLHGTIWELPLDAPGDEATVGGVIASAAEGPRRGGFGRVRRQVLGLQMIGADGTVSRCGGRVVKNVTGYDLAKLHVGARGTLGVIASAWLRLKPRPETTRTLSARFDELAPACAAAGAAARLGSARMTTLLSGDLAAHVSGLVDRSGAWVLAIELAGSEALCARDAAVLVRESNATERSFSVDAIGSTSLAQEGECVRIRAGVLPGHLAEAIETFRNEGLSIAAHPDPGVIEASLDAGRSGEATRVIAHLDALGDRFGGPITFDRRGETWCDPPPEPGASELWTALERSFDPHGVLNPGRVPGGV